MRRYFPSFLFLIGPIIFNQSGTRMKKITPTKVINSIETAYIIKKLFRQDFLNRYDERRLLYVSPSISPCFIFEMDRHSPISPISPKVELSKPKQTPSTSTKKRLEASTFVIDEEEYSFSPNSDEVFDLTDVTLQTPEVQLTNVRRLSVPSKKQKGSVSSNGGSAVCRICHGGEFSSPVKGEPLISACYCRGTMGLFHRSCLEMWLSASNRDQCEICKFQYVTERLPRPFSEFLKNPGSTAAKRNLIGDFICWCILTPLTAASAFMCVTGAVHYAGQNQDTVEVPGLICLAVFLVITYGVWLTVSIRYHYKVWIDWRARNQKVSVVEMKEIRRRTHTNSFGAKSDLVNKNRRPAVASTDSDTSIHYQVPWNSSLQVFRANLLTTAIAPSQASLNIRFAYPITPMGMYETAV